MASHLPPVPPAGRSDKGPGGDAKPDDADPKARQVGRPPANLAEQDHQGNIKQNTTHQGHQQDR